MKIDRIILAPAEGAFFYDDQAAIRAGVRMDGFVYEGLPVTSGFSAVRMPAKALGVGLVLSDGEVAWGDMMSVQYAGGSGRDPVFRIEDAERLVRHVIAPRVSMDPAVGFRDACALLLAPTEDGDRLPLAVEYGFSQALLRACAHARHRTMVEVICEEYDLAVVPRKIPVYAQSGDARYLNVDKMILKGVDILPHGLINSREKFGGDGGAFLEFVRWVSRRVAQLGQPGYAPTLHFDVYGWVGLALGLDVRRIAEFVARTAEQAAPFRLNIESPADFASRAGQIEGFAAIRAELGRLGCDARVVADEWCNTLDDVKAFCAGGGADLIQIKMPDVGRLTDTVEAVLECKRLGVGAYLGGSCVETDLSAQVSTHVAVATQADMLLAKPGMGVDEGLSIVRNEQSRLLATLHSRETVSSPPESVPTHV